MKLVLFIINGYPHNKNYQAIQRMCRSLNIEYEESNSIDRITQPNYDILLSGGISDDISFEQGLLEKYPNLSGYGFDGTIEKIPENNFSNRFNSTFSPYTPRSNIPWIIPICKSIHSC